MMPSSLQAALFAVSLSLAAVPGAQAASIIQDLGGNGSQIEYASPVGQSFTAESARIDSFGFHVVDSNAAMGPTFTVAIELEMPVFFDGAHAFFLHITRNDSGKSTS